MTTTITPCPAPPRYVHPTPDEVESYRLDAHEAGLREARGHLAAGSPMLAYLAVVHATEAEAKIVGYGGIRIPVMDALRRLPAGRVRKAVA